MTNTTSQNGYAASQARNAVDKTADFWTQGARGLTDRIPRLPQIDLIPAVERYFDFVQRTVDINRYLAVKWVEAAGTLTGVVRDQAELAADVVRQAARQAHDQARERYEGLTKAELSDQLAERGPAQDGQRRRAHQAPDRGRQQVSRRAAPRQ